MLTNMKPTPDNFSDCSREEQVRFHFGSTHDNICTNYLIPSPIRLTPNGKMFTDLVISPRMNSGKLEEILTAVMPEQVFLEEDYFLSFYTKIESDGFANLPFYKRWNQSKDKILKYLKDYRVNVLCFFNLVGFAVLGQAVEQGLLTEEIDPNHDYLYRVRRPFQPELPLTERYSSDHL